MGGIGCAVVTQPGDAVLHSRYTNQALYWEDFENGGEALVEMLMRFGSAQPEPPVLYYQQDAQLLMVSRQRERLSKAFRFVVPDAELVEDFVDKARFQILAERLDLPVPRTRRIDLATGTPAIFAARPRPPLPDRHQAAYPLHRLGQCRRPGQGAAGRKR